MSKKLSRPTLLIGLCILGILSLALLGYRGIQATKTQSPTPTPSSKTPLKAGRAIQSPNVTDKPVTGQIIVQFKSQYTDAQINEQLKKYNASISKKIPEIKQTVVRVPKGQEDAIVKKLQTDGYIETAQRDYTTHALYAPNDQGFTNQWALNNTGQVVQGAPGQGNDDIRAVTAWNVSLGNGIKVAILDTGINLSHPDLAGKIVAQKVFTTNSIEDNNGHGTHVAGIIAANTNNGIGVAGVCPNCQLIIGKVMDDNGDGTTSNTIAGIIWAADQGAKVINLSLGTTDPASSPLYQQAITYANQKGAVIVAAAGNSNTAAKLYPAANQGVISVGATDNTNKKASFSSYGDWVKLAAPGTNILSTMPNHTNEKGVLNYGYDSGTSMAGPFVAGVAALVAATQYGTSPQAIENRLYATANKINGTGTFWSQGLVNATDAVGAGADSSQPAFACVGGSGAPPCAQIPDVQTQGPFDALPGGQSYVTPGPSAVTAPTSGALPGFANTGAPLVGNSYNTTTPCTGSYVSQNSDTSIQSSKKKKDKDKKKKDKSSKNSSYNNNSSSGGAFLDQFTQFFYQLINLLFRVGNVATPCTPVDVPPADTAASPSPVYSEPSPAPDYGNVTPTLAYGVTPPYAIGTPVYGYDQPTPPYYAATPTLFYGYGPTPTPPPPPYGQPTPTPPAYSPANDEIVIFNDGLENGWSDASFDSTESIILSPVFSGSASISTTIKANGGLDFQSTSGVFTNLSGEVQFSLKASQANQAYEVYADTQYGKPLKDPVSLANYGGQPTETGWKTYNIPLADLNAVNVNLRDIVIHDSTGTDQPVLYVDQVKLHAVSTQTPLPTQTQITPQVSGTPNPTATAEATLTPTDGISPTLSLTGTLTPTDVLSPTPGVTSAATPTLGITLAPTATTVPTVRPTATTAPTATRAPTLVPTAVPTVAPTARPTVTPTPTPSLIVRRSIYSLSPTELQRLAAAFNTLKSNGTYQRFANTHMQAMNTFTPPNDPSTFRNAAHRGPAFLPWHRGLVWEFEQELRKVDPTVSLPYWPFEQDASTANAGQIPRLFSAAYIGSDGNRNQSNRVTDGPFASWGIIRMIGRDPQGLPTLPTQAEVNTLLQYNNYDSAPYDESSSGFRNGIEGWIGTNGQVSGHNRVHLYVGGDMAVTFTGANSVNDPAFWLLHADIDRIWWEWQQAHGQNNYQPTSGGPTGHNLNDIMQLLPERFTPASTLSTQSMGYTYQ